MGVEFCFPFLSFFFFFLLFTSAAPARGSADGLHSFIFFVYVYSADGFPVHTSKLEYGPERLDNTLDGQWEAGPCR